MHYVLAALLLLGLLYGPQLWVRYVFWRYGSERKDLPGTGAELARHLLKRFGIDGVAVETTEAGDHYDPNDRKVRLSPSVHDGRSLTAVAVAAHEVGHALQHHRGEPILRLRHRMVRLAQGVERIGAGALVALPVVGAITRSPGLGLLLLLLAVASLAAPVLVQFITLPVELDASFRKALPVLRQGNYVAARDQPAVQRVLRAAALTYVAASLSGLLNLWRWLRLLRRG